MQLGAYEPNLASGAMSDEVTCRLVADAVRRTFAILDLSATLRTGFTGEHCVASEAMDSLVRSGLQLFKTPD